jgi:hypothetical protein
MKLVLPFQTSLCAQEQHNSTVSINEDMVALLLLSSEVNEGLAFVTKHENLEDKHLQK